MGKKLTLLTSVFLTIFLGGNIVQAEESFEISGWIPYWRADQGITSVLPHLNLFSEINPFAYSVKLDGSLNQASQIDKTEWLNLQAQAKLLGVKYIPTVMWANSDVIDTTLRDPQKRQAHIRAIASEIFKYGFDGIDIDYEAKYARTRPYFSLFLKELEEAIGFNKWIMCTIESRTPLDSRYSSPESIPTDIEYANDFVEINKYCDRVRIMAYDQGRIDLKLNKANEDPYIPVADLAWVEKVMLLASETIDKNKLIIGVPTYGYEYDMFDATDGSGKKQYSQLWSLNPGYAIELMEKLNLQPTRSNTGELMLTFPASMSPEPIPLTYATRVISWSDAESIRQKAELAKKLGLRGIAIFKIDGGQDPKLWNAITGYKKIGDITTTPPITPPILETPITPKFIFNRDLEVGSKGDDVKNLQKYLNSKQFIVSVTGAVSIGNETSFFGSATKSALIKFQKANNISPTIGYFGPKTRAVIETLN